LSAGPELNKRGNPVKQTILVAFLLFFGGPQAAFCEVVQSCFNEVCFPRTIDRTEQLSVVGVARYRYWGFSLYTAAFYANGTPVLDSDGLISRQESELRIRYKHDIEASDFIESGEAFVKKNPLYKAAIMEESLKTINGLYRSVKAGDEYRIHYLPQKGFELWLNDVRLGFVEGEDFGRVYLGIWLSKKYGLDEDLSESLTGER